MLKHSTYDSFILKDLSLKLRPKKSDPYQVFQATSYTVIIDTEKIHNTVTDDWVTAAGEAQEKKHVSSS